MEETANSTNYPKAIQLITRFIVEFDCLDSFDDITNAVKRAFIDTLGVTIAGVNESASIKLRDFVSQQRSIPVCTVIGSSQKVSAIDAALSNGTTLHSLDFDDTGAYTQGHPSAPIFPAILAVAEENFNNGKEIIEAYAIGVEVLSRFSRAMPMMHLKGWHPSSVLGTIAATAVSARLLKLNETETIHALCIAATQSCGLIKNFGSMCKPFHVGRASSNGVLSAYLAKSGFSGNIELFEGDLNFFRVFGYQDKAKIENAFTNIGNPLAIIEPGINIKRYPACSLSHRAIDALLYIKKNYDVTMENVLKIECRVPPRAVKVLFYNSPKNGLEAKFSMPFVLSCALKYGSPSPSHFKDEVVKSQDIQKLMSIVDFNVHPDWKDGDDARGDIVKVYTKSGEVFEHNIEIPIGNVKNQLSDGQLLEKYNGCTSSFLTSDTAQNIIEFINTLENAESIHPLTDCLREINAHNP